MSAAVFTTAALLRVADPDGGSATQFRARSSPAHEPVTAVVATAEITIPGPPDEHPIGADDLERALMAADGGIRDLVIQRMLPKWTATDPQAAARFAELQTDSFLREVALRTVAHVWAETDPGSASHWVTSLADEAERATAIAVVATTMGESDPRAALELLSGNGSDARSDNACIGVIASWASRDFAAAQSWAEAQPPGPLRNNVVQRLVFLRAHTDPLAAASLASQMLIDETARHEAHASIIGLWVARDPEGIRRWAAYEDMETRLRVEEEFAISESRVSPD